MRRRALPISMAVTAVVLTALGLVLAPLREALHTELLVFGAVLFWPLMVLATFILITLPFTLLLGPSAEFITSPLSNLWGRMAIGWARFLAKQRHPVVLGIAAGLVLGYATQWAIVAITILPGEWRTTVTMARARADVEAAYAQHGSLPDTLPPSDLVDGFGRPMRYEVHGVWKLATWELVSYGYDGKPGHDDFCVAGTTPLVKTTTDAINRAATSVLNHILDGTPLAKQDEFSLILASGCHPSVDK